MKHHSLRSYALVVGIVAAGMALGGVNSSAATDVAGSVPAPQAGLTAVAPSAATSASASWLGSFARLEGAGGGEIAARIGSTTFGGDAVGNAALEAPATSPILGTHPKLGNIAAPITRFRDGGHAYYLFGMGLHSCTYVGKCMDLFAPIGEPVYAFADGEVAIPKYAPHSYGNYIKIKFRDGSEAIYAHLSRITVNPGPVAAGTQIGAVGCSGTTGEKNNCKKSEQHLHFEWSGLKWKSGQYGEIPPYFAAWRGDPARCYDGCGPDTGK